MKHWWQWCNYALKTLAEYLMPVSADLDDAEAFTALCYNQSNGCKGHGIQSLWPLTRLSSRNRMWLLTVLVLCDTATPPVTILDTSHLCVSCSFSELHINLTVNPWCGSCFSSPLSFYITSRVAHMTTVYISSTMMHWISLQSIPAGCMTFALVGHGIKHKTHYITSNYKVYFEMKIVYLINDDHGVAGQMLGSTWTIHNPVSMLLAHVS